MQERSALCASHGEEVANAISHTVGAVLSALGLALMCRMAVSLSAWHVVGVGIFGASLVTLYSASAWYHFATTEKAKRWLQILDHCLIFVLIAGSYTPWLLVNLHGHIGWTLLAVVWGLALGGIILKAIFLPRFDRLGVAIYVLMGWLVCLVFRPLVASTSLTGIVWLVAGGLFYTAGVYFYLRENLRYGHFIWHLFVMAGSLCHVIAVITGVLV